MARPRSFESVEVRRASSHRTVDGLSRAARGRRDKTVEGPSPGPLRAPSRTIIRRRLQGPSRTVEDRTGPHRTVEGRRGRPSRTVFGPYGAGTGPVRGRYGVEGRDRHSRAVRDRAATPEPRLGYVSRRAVSGPRRSRTRPARLRPVSDPSPDRFWTVQCGLRPARQCGLRPARCFEWSQKWAFTAVATVFLKKGPRATVFGPCDFGASSPHPRNQRRGPRDPNPVAPVARTRVKRPP